MRTQELVLVVAKKVPDVVGLDVAEGIRTLNNLGFHVLLKTIQDSNAEDNKVLGLSLQGKGSLTVFVECLVRSIAAAEIELQDNELFKEEKSRLIKDLSYVSRMLYSGAMRIELTSIISRYKNDWVKELLTPLLDLPDIEIKDEVNKILKHLMSLP